MKVVDLSSALACMKSVVMNRKPREIVSCSDQMDSIAVELKMMLMVPVSELVMKSFEVEGLCRSELKVQRLVASVADRVELEPS